MYFKANHLAHIEALNQQSGSDCATTIFSCEKSLSFSLVENTVCALRNQSKLENINRNSALDSWMGAM